MNIEYPKLFISYSWSNNEHQQWVIDLATQLMESGVDVILDKWELKEGNDTISFMEKMVTDSNVKKVIMICDKVYAEKADKRSGGVGTETQIISPEIYAKQDQNKFVAVLSERDEKGNPYIPTYYKSRIHIDLSNSDLYSSNFERLLRWIFDKPLNIKPEIGKPPAFLMEQNAISLGTTIKYKRALEAIRTNKDYAKGALEEYFSEFVANLERFRITNKNGEIDDKVIDSIERFIPFRNEAIEVFFSIAKYRNDQETIQLVHRFFEDLIPYTKKPKDVSSWQEGDFDNFKFIIHELFLYAIACLIKYECFDAISYLLSYDYYFEDNADYGRNTMVPFTFFRQYLRSFIYRNERLQLGRLSIHADLLIKRTETSGITDRQLMQADFVLFIKDCLNVIYHKSEQSWSPITLVYASHVTGVFEIFARSQSSIYFNHLRNMFDHMGKDSFELIIKRINENVIKVPRWGFDSFDPGSLMGINKLDTRP
jgi:hypothetical protein